MKKFLRASLPALYFCALFTVAGAQSRSLDGARQFAFDSEGNRDGAAGHDGDRVTNFNWANVNRAPFSAAAFDKPLGFEAEGAPPKFVIEGVKAEGYDDVMSGIFLGRVNKNAALTAGARSGAARAVITTFRLADSHGKDEYARRLIDEVIRLVSAEGFELKMTID